MKQFEWIDNADSWLCPICRAEVWSPTVYGYHCPKCGFIAERDKKFVFGESAFGDGRLKKIKRNMMTTHMGG